MKDLKIAALQMQLTQGATEGNIQHLSTWLSKLPEGIDLLVLPETWSTGFMMREEDLAKCDLRASFDQAKAFMLQIAQTHKIALYGSLTEPLDDGRYRNHGLFVTPQGEVTSYFKRHLFRPGGEAKHFEAGNEVVEVDYKGWRIRLSICYDLRFPVWLRQHPQSDRPYDLLLNVANWPHPREKVWQRLLKARAIENQAYVVGVNRVGRVSSKLYYPGHSIIVDAFGEVIEEGSGEVETLLLATLSHEELQRYRERFPVLHDADQFTLHY